MTLDELIKWLQKRELDEVIKLSISKPHSWRGEQEMKNND